LRQGTKPYGCDCWISWHFREAAKGSPIEFIFPKTGVKHGDGPDCHYERREKTNLQAKNVLWIFCCQRRPAGLDIEQVFARRGDIGRPKPVFLSVTRFVDAIRCGERR